MTTAAERPAPSPRPRFLLASIVLLACASVSCLLIAVLGSRHHVRFDLTSTRQFSLSERTRLVLDGLTDPVTIVVSADLSTLDRETRLRMSDLLDEFGRASPRIRSTWIDTGSASAQGDFNALIASLAGPHEEELARQRSALESIADDSSATADSLRLISDSLKALAEGDESLPAASRANARDQAGLVRTIAASLSPAADALRSAASHSIAGVSLPAADTARDAATDPLNKASRAAAAIADYSAALERAASAASARPLTQLASATRDRAARAADQLAHLRAADPLIISRVLQQTSAVLVTSASGTIALDFATLFPSSAMLDPNRTDARDTLFVGEQMISTALGALTQPVAPIAVFVHAQTVNLLDERGEPTPPALGAFRRLFDRLRLTRTTPAEWAVASQPLPPSLASIDPQGNRPVVWIVLGAPARSSADSRQSGLADRNSRVAGLGAALKSLVEAGEQLLVCIEPSDLPSIGEPDPIAAALAPLGFTIDSARPILRREPSPQGMMTWTHHSIASANTAQPIGRAVDGLRLVLPWATSIELRAVPGVNAAPIVTLPRDDHLWGESQWMLLRDLVGRGLARPLAPLLLAESPTVDPQRDAPSRGDLVVAAAAERIRSETLPAPRAAQATSPQRCVVVASPEWLHDAFTQASEDVAGRRVLLFPGNLELFDAALAWLAGRDDQIAPGPQSRDVPRIKPIPESALRALRVLLIAGLPALPLILAALLRLLRG
ncbi:MAG: Gldg family protein [Phycisphaerae bacterium]|nr:Gldg family protein [Phycisphaerae bacterium]